MAAPKLSMRYWDINQSLNGNGQIDLSALTGYSYLQGADGSDFFVPYGIGPNDVPVSGVSLQQYFEKNLGGSQLRPALFCDDATAHYGAVESGGLVTTWTAADLSSGSRTDANHTGASAVTFVNSGGYSPPRDWGVRVPGIVAKRGQARTAVFLWDAQRSVVALTATISDGSSSPARLPPFMGDVNGSPVYFAVDYVPGPDADATVTLEARVIGTNPAQSYNTLLIGLGASYIQMPRQLPSPRAYRHYIRSHGV